MSTEQNMKSVPVTVTKVPRPAVPAVCEECYADAGVHFKGCSKWPKPALSEVVVLPEGRAAS